MPEQTRQLAAIMFTDIVGYTALMGANEQHAFDSLRKNRELQQPIVEEFNGRFIKELGDGTLVSFSTVSDAVHAALKIQKECHAAQDFQLRIGIHLGEVVFENNDVFGDGVNIASRIQAIAEPGEIYISESVYNNIANKADVETRYLRKENLKNVREPIKIYQVLAKTGKVDKSTAPSRTKRISRTWLMALGLLAVIITIAALVYFTRQEKTPVNLEKSIAILPFSNLSSDEENQYFADGLVEDMLNRLSTIEGFKVISRTSSEMYRDRGTKSVPQIATELGVSYILEGSIQRMGDKARFNVQLIDASHDNHIWAKNFDRDLEDVFKIQSEIAIEIASELNTLLTVQQTSDITKNRTSNIKAFELYQLGRFHWNKRTGAGYKTSIEYFEQAIAEDPYYGLAYAGLADSYNLMALQGHINEKEGRNKAEALANKALELDATLAEAHNVLASLYTYIDWNWKAAEQEYLMAIKLNPNYSTAYHYYSEHLCIMGRHEEARLHIDKAIELDPLSFVIRYVSQKLYFHRGQFEKALAENQRCHELNDEHPWLYWWDFDINLMLGNGEAALKEYKEAGQFDGDFNSKQADSAYQALGLEGLLRLDLQITEGIIYMATIHGYLGEDENAMDLIEQRFNSIDSNVTPSAEIVYNYAFRNLNSNPRWLAILKKMNLPMQ